MSLVSGSKLENLSEAETEKDSRSKKVVPGERRRRRRKAVGDGVVIGEYPLKSEKCEAVSVEGRCALERVVSMKKSMIKFHKRTVKGTIMRPMLKYPSFPWNRTWH